MVVWSAEGCLFDSNLGGLVYVLAAASCYCGFVSRLVRCLYVFRYGNSYSCGPGRVVAFCIVW